MGNVIAFVPASGGVGASTLAAAVAVRSAAAARSSVAVDLDGPAGRLDVVFGVEESAGWRWPELTEVSGVVDGASLAAELPVACGVPVLSGAGGLAWSGTSGPREWLETLPDVVVGLAEAHETTVLDLPRDAAVLEAVGLLVDAVVVVAGAHVSQLAAAQQVVPGVRGLLARLRDHNRAWERVPLLPIEPWLVLRGNRGGRGGRVEGELEDLLVDELDVPLVAALPDERRIVAEVADGLPPGARGRGAVVRAADEILVRLMTQAVAA